MLHMRIVLIIFMILFIASIAAFLYALIKLFRNTRSNTTWLMFSTALILVLLEIWIFRMAHLWL
jgi:divalent metal cation (Fe/Co/Zn/Cd) transporter